MSTTYDDFYGWLQGQLEGLSLVEKAHTIQRVYEKLRLIHNAVGKVYTHKSTITQFKTQYSNVYDKIKTELAPYIADEYLTTQGWRFFEYEMFNPRHDAVIAVLMEIRVALRNNVALHEVEGF